MAPVPAEQGGPALAQQRPDGQVEVGEFVWADLQPAQGVLPVAVAVAVASPPADEPRRQGATAVPPHSVQSRLVAISTEQPSVLPLCD